MASGAPLTQGDENDVVIVSFVRSNKESRIGFLAIQNRLTVALSRAKCGMYVYAQHFLVVVVVNARSPCVLGSPREERARETVLTVD